MAAWRGRRAMTWITGVVAFVASVVECFTGYLSQSNFDSQWISASGKDAFNSVSVGAFFNLMNTGQMLLWHVVLIPVVLVALVGAHVLLVRVRGVSHPIDAHSRDVRSRRARRKAIAAAELNGTSKTATYGPPYNNGTASVQTLFITPQTWFGVTQPVSTAQDFVISPLAKTAPADPVLASALAAYSTATSAQQLKWATAYGNAVTKVKFTNGTPVVPTANDGPVPAMLAAELTLARSGGLDTVLLLLVPFIPDCATFPG